MHIHTRLPGDSLAAGVTIEVSHGYRVRSRDDEFVKEADVFGENFSDAAMPNSYLVDMLPFRKQFFASNVMTEFLMDRHSCSASLVSSWHGL